MYTFMQLCKWSMINDQGIPPWSCWWSSKYKQTQSNTFEYYWHERIMKISLVVCAREIAEGKEMIFLYSLHIKKQFPWCKESIFILNIDSLFAIPWSKDRNHAGGYWGKNKEVPKWVENTDCLESFWVQSHQHKQHISGYSFYIPDV